jgi:hypothetical protein
VKVLPLLVCPYAKMTPIMLQKPANVQR